MIIKQIIFYIVLGLTLLISSLYIIWQQEKKPFCSLIMKSAASFCFAAFGAINIYLHGFFNLGTIFILIGLIASIFGDVLLAQLEFKQPDHKTKIIFSGMVAFSIAQIFYTLAVSATINFQYLYWAVLAGLIISLVIVFGEKLLKLNYGKLKFMVGIYSFFLGVALIQSLITAILMTFNAFSTLLFIGLILFFVSDLILSFIYFSKESNRKLYYPNLAFYYAAQILIACAIMVA